METGAEKKLDRIVLLLTANLVVTTAFVVVVGVGLVPKVNRALDVTERVEARFQSFADDVQPVLKAGAGKAVSTIEGMDTEGLSDKAEEKAGTLIDAAADKAQRYLDKDKGKE